MIVLLEPPRCAGFVSGGFRYQEQIGRHLERGQHGELRVVAPDRLRATVRELAAAGSTVVVDGLFAAHAPLPPGALALLHMVPSRREWNEIALPVIATAATTAQAAGVATRATGIEVVRPGIDDLFTPDGRASDPRRPLHVVQVGTICPQKGQLLLVRAMREHAARCTLTLLGDTSTDPDYVAAVRQAAGPLPLSTPGCVPAAEVAATLRDSDLFVSASRQESFGMAVAEAIACGVAVLAFAAGEIPHFVRNGCDGWLLDPAADDAAFVALLRQRLASPRQLAAVRRASPAVRLSTWEVTASLFRAACARLAPTATS